MTKEQIQTWVKDASADGWELNPTYDNEPVDFAATLKRDGFTARIILREFVNKATGRIYMDYSIHVWGPDGLQIAVPVTYSWESVYRALDICLECGRDSEHVQRVGFAGRCCDACAPAARKRDERAGWTN